MCVAGERVGGAVTLLVLGAGGGGGTGGAQPVATRVTPPQPAEMDRRVGLRQRGGGEGSSDLRRLAPPLPVGQRRKEREQGWARQAVPWRGRGRLARMPSMRLQQKAAKLLSLPRPRRCAWRKRQLIS